MPKTRHCAQTQKNSTTKPLMNTESPTPEQPIDPTDTAMIEEFLSATEARQDAALEQLEARLDAMGDKFAARVRTMVERGLIAAREKSIREIRSIDVGFYLQAPLEILNGNDAHTLEANVEAVQ
jgi:hypothetical protein